MTPPPASGPAELWCRGCRRDGVRRLDHAERAWLADLRARHLRRVATGVLLPPVALLVAAATLAAARVAIGPPLTTAGGFALLTVLLMTLPLSLLLLRDHLGEFRSASRDLAGGDAWWFEPPVWPDAAAGASGVPFGVLPHSRRLVDLDARGLVERREDVIETEPQSEPGWYAPLSLRVSGPDPDPGFRQRSLDPRERTELARAEHELRWPTPRAWLTFGAMLLALSLILPARPDAAHGSAWAVVKVACWLVIGARVVQRYVRGVRLAGSMRRDLEAGLVVHAPGARGPGEEFLPFSRLMWRSGGAPAGWRDRRRAAQRLAASL